MSAWTKGPWIACNMIHAEHGGPMTPEEIGEYVKNNVLKSIENGGSATEFLFISTVGDDVPDICHVGNGPRRAANAQLIASAPALVSALEDAVHRVRWLKQFVPDTDPIDEELARWDAALRLARGEG